MEITKEQINEAIQKDPRLVEGILPTIQESEAVKTLITNKADVIYKEKIGEEVKKIHQQYDDDVFSVLGERPGTGEDGNKVKTYEFIKSKYQELKDLRSQKDSLTKDAKVQELQAEIERLKNEGGGKHVQEIFDQAKLTWETERNGLMKQIDESSKEREKFIKSTEIQNAFKQLKINPDTPDSIKKMVLDNVEAQLINQSKVVDGKIEFLDKDGKTIIDQKDWKPQSAINLLLSLDAIKDITLKEEKGGGGAKTEIHGSIETKNVEGKDTKRLTLPEGSFKTRQEFIEVSEKALLDSGITRNDPLWDELKNKAYNEYKVSELPRTA